MGGRHELAQAQLHLVADRQVGMAAFGRRDGPACGQIEHRGRVEPCADADHQFGRLRAGVGTRQDRADIGGVQMAERMALRLQIVQDRHRFGLGRALQRCFVDGPVQIGHRRAPVAHRACHGHAGCNRIDAAFVRDIAAQHRF
jgi:hypothetical protein